MQNNMQVVAPYIESATITQTSDHGFANNIQNLTALIESIGSITDGTQPIVKSIKVFLKGRTTTTANPILACPVIVQTAGTFTDTVDLADTEPRQNHLGTAIDDEFGFQYIGDFKGSTLRNTEAANYFHIWEHTFEIPRNIINLLNKEVNTERLQSLYLGLLGNQSSVTGVFLVNTQMVVKYAVKAKGITIR